MQSAASDFEALLLRTAAASFADGRGRASKTPRSGSDARRAPRCRKGRVSPAHCCAGLPSEPGRARFRASGSSKLVRVRWRRRRTVRSLARAFRPLVRSPRCSSWRLTCPRVLCRRHRLFTGSPDRVSTLSRPGTRPVSGQLSETTSLEGLVHRVPVSCCLSTAGIRFLVILFPLGDWALLTVGLPDARSRPDPDGVTAFRTRELRPGWVPPLPRGRRCSSRSSRLLDRRLPLLGGQSLHPRHQQSVDEGSLTRHQRGFKHTTRTQSSSFAFR